MRIGLPQVIISDQGREFYNQLDDSMAELLGIKRRLTTPYHPKVMFHITMEISVHSVENIPRYTADTVGRCATLVYYLVMHTHMKPDSTVDTL